MLLPGASTSISTARTDFAGPARSPLTDPRRTISDVLEIALVLIWPALVLIQGVLYRLYWAGAHVIPTSESTQRDSGGKALRACYAMSGTDQSCAVILPGSSLLRPLRYNPGTELARCGGGY
eukprot:623893-Rhodomonas_salina.1